MMDTGSGEHGMADQAQDHLGSRGVEYERQPGMGNRRIVDGALPLEREAACAMA